MVTLIGGDQLLERAHQAHLRARTSTATPRDQFLLLADEAAEMGTATNGMRQPTRDQFSQIQELLKKKSKEESKLRKEREEGWDEFNIRCIRSAQRSHCMTSFSLNGVDAGCYLPGGAPLVDHLLARVVHMPDWWFLQSPLQALRTRRLPDMVRPASQREFTLGESPEHHVEVALEFLKASMQLTKNTFFVCTLAADTESIGVVRDDFDKLCQGEPGDTHVLRVANRGESADTLPVLLMVGQVGWQVHVRIPTVSSEDASGRRTLKIVPGTLQKGVSAFFKAIGRVTGVGITDDLRQFFDLVNQLYGVDLWRKTKPPIELEQLAQLAGYNLPRTAVEVINWVCYGTILAKGRVSQGDGTWDLPWDLQRGPRRVYLAGDISQPAGAATLFWYISAMFVFPDISIVRQLGPLDGPSLIVWWKDTILPVLSFRGDEGPGPTQQSVQQIWGSILASKKTGRMVATLQPDWPSVTAGGPRYTHSVRTFHVQRCVTLEDISSSSWPRPPPEALHLAIFGRHQLLREPTPTAPVDTLGWSPNPGVEGILAKDAPNINWTLLSKVIGNGVGLKSLLNEYARIKPGQGQALMERLEADPRVARTVLGNFEKAKRVVPSFRAILEDCNHLPPRPEGWVDIFRQAEATQAKIARIAKHAELVSQHAFAQMTLSLGRYRQLQTASKQMKKDPPARMDLSWSMMQHLAPAGRAPDFLPPSMIASVGVSTRPGRKRDRSTDTAQTPPTSKRTRRTVSIGADDPDATDPMALLRRSLTTNQGSPRARSPTPPQEASRPDSPTHLPPTGVFLVGGRHAVHANHGLEGSMLRAPTTTVRVTDWHPDAIREAADDLSSYDLRGATVVMWLFDDMVFEQMETGDPLFRDSYDGRLHCLGPIGVSGWMAMPPLLDEARPLLDACRQAESVVLMAPLPMYLGTSCCEERDHCLGYYHEDSQRHICREVINLYEAMVRWLSWEARDNVHVACPHLELMATARTLGVGGLSFVLSSYSYDGIHLSADGYRDVFDRLAMILRREPWRYRPPMERMPDPEIGPPRSRSARRPVRDRLGWRGPGHLPRGIEALVDRFQGDEEPRVLSAEAERDAYRGAYRRRSRSRSRSQSPPISPSFWAQVRATAPPVSRPPGGRPE